MASVVAVGGCGAVVVEAPLPVIALLMALTLSISSTALAANNQRDVAIIANAMTAGHCWGGAIADRPGGYVHTMPRLSEYLVQLQYFHCEANFAVNASDLDTSWSIAANTPLNAFNYLLLVVSGLAASVLVMV